MKKLLVSNSILHQRGYLDHVASAATELFQGSGHIAFVPYALFDRDAYAEKAEKRFQELGMNLRSIHRAPDPKGALESADGIFIGGGNTFRLLTALYRHDLVEAIQARVADGVPYMGSSAGSIVAGPTIMTTKDMPIIQPPSFMALNLVGFQISPHYLDPDPNSTHMGETQEERILQYLEENHRTVIGLREGSFLRCDRGSAILHGPFHARVFQRESPPLEAVPGTELYQYA